MSVNKNGSMGLDYYYSKLDRLDAQYDSIEKDKNTCALRMKDLEAIIEENSHLDTPNSMVDEEQDLNNLYEYYDYLCYKNDICMKARQLCQRHIRDLLGQMEEGLDM